MFLYCFELLIILKLFISTKVVTSFRNQRRIFRYLLISYFIIRQNKSGQNNTHCIDSTKANLEVLFLALGVMSNSSNSFFGYDEGS